MSTFKKKNLPLPCTFPPEVASTRKKKCWWMNLSYNVSCWQLRRYGGAIYSRLVEISSSDVPDTARCRLPDLPGPEKSPPLQSVGTICLWILMTSVRTRLTEATTSSARDQIITPSFVSFAVKATFSGSRRRNRPADGWDLLYFPILFNAVVFFPPSRSLRGGSGVHL